MSRRFLKSALYSAHKFFVRERLSYATRADYQRNAKLMMKQLHEGGYQLENIRHFKRRHVDYLVNRWKEEKLSAGTIKNRLAEVRYIFRRINRIQSLPKSNDDFGIAHRVYRPKTNRAQTVDVNKIENIFVRCSVKLQELFGLRREESIKFVPSYADRGDFIELKASWTKGGITRRIPITDPIQRRFLNQLKGMFEKGRSMIPINKNYREQQNKYTAEIRKAGFKNLHGLRHAYAQRRYRTLTAELSKAEGWECPINGGPKKRELTEQQKIIDERVRFIIANELGHSRVEITKIYCGK